jgi:sec-independent protein translocase protein TatB
VSFGLTVEKLALVGLVALLIVGPDRLPAYAAQLARLVKRLKGMAQGAESRLRDEFGDDFDPDEWRKLDPRKYDPRRIIRDALRDEVTDAPVAVAKSVPAPKKKSGGATPFDSEST